MLWARKLNHVNYIEATHTAHSWWLKVVIKFDNEL